MESEMCDKKKTGDDESDIIFDELMQLKNKHFNTKDMGFEARIETLKKENDMLKKCMSCMLYHYHCKEFEINMQIMNTAKEAEIFINIQEGIISIKRK